MGGDFGSYRLPLRARRPLRRFPILPSSAVCTHTDVVGPDCVASPHCHCKRKKFGRGILLVGKGPFFLTVCMWLVPHCHPTGRPKRDAKEWPTRMSPHAEN